MQVANDTGGADLVTANDEAASPERTLTHGVMNPEHAGTPFRDALYERVVGLSSQGNVCMRCKLEGHVLSACVLESNVFPAKRTLPCRLCQQTIFANLTLVTKLTRGRLAGSYVHRDCAVRWFKDNPRENTNDGMPVLKFHTPCEELVAFLERFVKGEGPLFNLSAVAGAGKSNCLIYVVTRLRELSLTFIILVFNVTAKEELIARGLLNTEVANFHSFLMKAYRRWVGASLNEQAVMASDVAPGPFAKAEPEIVPQMMRLVLSFFLREHECRVALTKLLRPFVAELCDQARSHGFGTPEGPSNFDTDALAHLVERYKIEGKLSAAWDGQLSQPEKLQIDRVIGASEVDRLEYAIRVTANVLELALVMASSTSVDGERYLHNEVQRKQIGFPATDVKGVETIALARELFLGSYDRVLVDEAQDANNCELQVVERVKTPTGSVAFFGDDCQSAYLWLGVERSDHERYLKDAITYVESRNYRSARLICNEAQVYLDQLGRNVTIQPMRGVDGAVEYGPFWAHPIDSTKRTLIIGRSSKHVIAFFAAMVSLGYPVTMHGMESTSNSIMTALKDLRCFTVAQVKTKVTAYLATRSASTKSMDYEMYSAINSLVPTFLEKHPSVDEAHPNSIDAFKAWTLEQFSYKLDGVGSIELSSIHAAKGKEGDTYIINPSLTPLKERLDGSDWERYEELCLAYIARTRANDRLVYLPDLQITSRAEILALFTKPKVHTSEVDDVEGGGESQGSTTSTSTVSTAGAAASSAIILAEDAGDARLIGAENVKYALAALMLSEMPSTLAQLDAAVRARLLQTRPSATLGSDEGEQNKRAVLAARQTIRSEMAKGK